MSDLPEDAVYTWLGIIWIQLMIAVIAFSSCIASLIMAFREDSALGILFFMAAIFEAKVGELLLQEVFKNFYRHVSWW